jgi:hypothetical protein
MFLQNHPMHRTSHLYSIHVVAKWNSMASQPHHCKINEVKIHVQKLGLEFCPHHCRISKVKIHIQKLGLEFCAKVGNNAIYILNRCSIQTMLNMTFKQTCNGRKPLGGRTSFGVALYSFVNMTNYKSWRKNIIWCCIVLFCEHDKLQESEVHPSGRNVGNEVLVIDKPPPSHGDVASKSEDQWWYWQWCIGKYKCRLRTVLTTEATHQKEGPNRPIATTIEGNWNVDGLSRSTRVTKTKQSGPEY